MIKATLKGFRCGWSVHQGIKTLLQELAALRLSEAQFSHINFYRLQKLESLWRSGKLADDLYWKTDEHPSELAVGEGDGRGD